MKNFLRKFTFLIALKETLVGVYYTIRSWWPLWFYMLNRDARMRYKNHPPNLNEVQQKIVRELKENGIATADIHELFPDRKNLLEELQLYAVKLRQSAGISQKKKFLLELWEPVPLLDFQNPFIGLSCEERILEIAAGYFEMYPKVYYSMLNVTLPVGEGETPVQSQRWHRDPEDKKICKMFIYLTDVDKDSGPFTYVTKSHHGGIWRRLFPQHPPHGSYPPLGVVEKIIPPHVVKECLAKAGTVIFCDTSGLHKGGYARTRERIMFTAGYIPPSSRWKTQYRYPDNFREILSRASPLVLYALTKK